MRRLLLKVWSSILDMVYPERERCFNCGARLFFPEIKGLCPECLGKIDFINYYCLHCGRVISSEKPALCRLCRSKPFNFNLARSVALYDGMMRELILKFKYGHILELKEPLSELLTLYFYHYYDNYRIDYLIPIPLHAKREEERGYNQAGVLADFLGKKCRIPVLTGALLRTKNSQPLYNLGPEERGRVIRGSFALADREKIKDKVILLIDDILTTGATVNEASLVLKEKGGIKSVYVLTLATGRIQD